MCGLARFRRTRICHIFTARQTNFRCLCRSNGSMKLQEGCRSWSVLINLGIWVYEAISIWRGFLIYLLRFLLCSPAILLMDFLTWHYSGKPTIASERPVIQIVYQSSLDGSYFKDGLEGPTLVSGQWKTQHFYRYGDGVTPDVAPSPPSTRFEERIRELKTKLQPIESSKQERIHELEMKLHAIEGSKGWRLLNSYRGLKKRIVS